MAKIKCAEHGKRVFVTENGVTHRGGRRLKPCISEKGIVKIGGLSYWWREIVRDKGPWRHKDLEVKSDARLNKLREAVTSDSPITEDALARRVGTKKPPKPKFAPWQNRPARTTE